MPRNVQWRRILSDVACASQAFAANATIYILRQTGPTGFLLKEEGETKNVKVLLGDPHSCTCPAFHKEKDLCKHICWVLLKKFRMSKEDPLSWQLGLSELEITQVLQGPVIVRQQQRHQENTRVQQKALDASGRQPLVPQREISADDVCPICQDELLEKKLPVTYCKYSCGNSVHIKCMKVWAEHQLKTSQDSAIKCPMCREDFGSIDLLRQELHNALGPDSTATVVTSAKNIDRHVGVRCSNCPVVPIEGKCYRCTVCADFYLCQACFNTPVHTHHLFQFRQKRNQRWRSALRTLGSGLPVAIVNNLMNRELSPSDYETLLQLDNQCSAPLSHLTDENIQLLPLDRVWEQSSLLVPGAQCRICLHGYQEGQYVRKLPCHHKFHKDCIDSWLLHCHPTCPVEGSPVFAMRARLDTPTGHSNRHHLSSSAPATETVSSSGRLGLIAVQLGTVQDRDRNRGEERGTLAQRPPRHPSMPHRPPSRLELTGSRFGSEESTTLQSRNEGPVSDSFPDGSRVLHQALQRRSRLNNHLTQFLLENNSLGGLEGDDTITASTIHPDDSSVSILQLNIRGDGPVDFSRMHDRRGSLGSTASLPEQGRQNKKNRQTRVKPPFIRQRSKSQDSQELSHTSAEQGLYLGRDPRLYPPPMGEVTAAGLMQPLRPGILRHSDARHRRRIQNQVRDPSIALEGTGFQHLTLRDIM